MAKKEWTKYWMIVDNTFYGKDADFDKLPMSAEEEALLNKSGNTINIISINDIQTILNLVLLFIAFFNFSISSSI